MLSFLNASEGCSVFVKVDSLSIAVELVMKILTCLVDLALCHEVALATKVLMIEGIECLTVLCVAVIDVIGLNAFIKKYFSITHTQPSFLRNIIMSMMRQSHDDGNDAGWRQFFEQRPVIIEM